jgi:hypothetical protein
MMKIELDVTAAVRNWNESEVEALGAVPNVGDEVIMHSRGQLRSAQVEGKAKHIEDWIHYTTKTVAIDKLYKEKSV